MIHIKKFMLILYISDQQEMNSQFNKIYCMFVKNIPDFSYKKINE